MAKARTVFVTAGQRFGRLTVLNPEIRIGSAQPSRPGGWRAAMCRCDCGTEKPVRLNHLLTGFVQSCGCLRDEGIRAVNLQHDLSRHPLFATWCGIIARCDQPQRREYPHYGGRGIKVCDRWHDVRLFLADIDQELGPRPDGLTLDRVDNDGHYEPGNVRWATRAQQTANRRVRRKS